MKFNRRDDYDKRFKNLKRKVMNNPDFLLVNVFDEAHHGATSKDSHGEDSMYEKFVNFWNSTVCVFVGYDISSIFNFSVDNMLFKRKFLTSFPDY